MNQNLPSTASDRDKKEISYTPFGENKPITLTLGMVRSHIAVPTRSGKVPSDSELIKFMMLCQARELNPWTGDAYLVGYDSQQGPKFSLITAIQALYKRAEPNVNYDGLESGVIVMRKGADGRDEMVERQGDFVMNGEILVGGWAKCYRKDRKFPCYEAIRLDTYSTGKSQWEKDPAGMIVKVAEAGVLRRSFPTQLGALYIEQERAIVERGEVIEAGNTQQNQSVASLTQEIVKKLPAPPAETKKTPAARTKAEPAKPSPAMQEAIDEQDFSAALAAKRQRQQDYEASLPPEEEPSAGELEEAFEEGPATDADAEQQEGDAGAPDDGPPEDGQPLGIVNWEYVEQRFDEAADLAQAAKLQDEFSSGAPPADVELVAKLHERAKKRIRAARAKAKNP